LDTRMRRSFPGTGRRTYEGEVCIQAILIGRAIVRRRGVEFHGVSCGGILARNPAFAPQIFQGVLDICQTSPQAPGQVLDADVETWVSEAEGEDVHVDRTANQDGKQGFRRTCHAGSLTGGARSRSVRCANATMRREPSAMRAVKHPNDADRMMACSHTMDSMVPNWWWLGNLRARRVDGGTGD
jgi:hypothetical protein